MVMVDIYFKKIYKTFAFCNILAFLDFRVLHLFSQKEFLFVAEEKSLLLLLLSSDPLLCPPPSPAPAPGSSHFESSESSKVIQQESTEAPSTESEPPCFSLPPSTLLHSPINDKSLPKFFPSF